jgi:hypothetical protein
MEMPVKIKMKETKPGSPDGIQVISYKAGEVYDIPVALAKAFVNEKWAEPWPPVKKPADEPVEAKMVSGAPDNKDAGSVDDNKTAGVKAGRSK